MCSMYKTAFLDLDGTLTDSSPGIINSVKYALGKMQMDTPSVDVLFKFIGPPLLDSFADCCGLHGEEGKTALKYYREYFSVSGLFENAVYDGVPEMLKRLKDGGIKVVLATSKPEKFALQILEHFHLAEYFDFMAGATMDETRNRKPEVITYALQECHVQDLSQVIMVGDRDYDITGAAECGIDSMGVLYGYGSREELEGAGATLIAATPEEVADLLLGE